MEKAGEQCGARNATRTEIWWAYGNPAYDDFISAKLEGNKLKAAVIAVNVYQGVNQSTPIGKVITFNTKGVNGNCSGGKDTNTYYYKFLPTNNPAFIISFVSTRHYEHTPLGGFTEIAEIHTNRGGGDDAGIAVMQKFSQDKYLEVWGRFKHTTDWAVVAVELR